MASYGFLSGVVRFKMLLVLSCPPPPRDRTGRRALVNGKELKLAMAALPLRRRLQPFIKFEIHGFSRQGSGATAAGTSKLCQPLKVSDEFRKKRRKSNIPMSRRSVMGFRAVEVGAVLGWILSRGNSQPQIR